MYESAALWRAAGFAPGGGARRLASHTVREDRQAAARAVGRLRPEVSAPGARAPRPAPTRAQAARAPTLGPRPPRPRLRP
jgi:hypothetical protein